MTTGFIIGAGGGAVELTQNTDLLRAGDKKVQFMCSQESPVTVKFVDGTEQELTSIGDLDVSGWDAGTYPIGCNKSGASKASFMRGDVTVSTTGIASNFSRTNYVFERFNQGENNWEVVTKIKTPTTMTQFNDIIGSIAAFGLAIGIDNTTNKFNLALGNNGSSWNIGTINGTTTVNLDTWYYLKTTFDGATYTLSSSLDGESYTTEVTINSTEKIVNSILLSIGTFITGTVWFEGEIDLTQTYFKVGDAITWNGADILNESYPYLGLITLNSDKAITKIKSSYVSQTKNTLEQVNIHTVDSYSRVTKEAPTELNMIPFTFVDLDYSSYETVSANTSYTLTKDVIVNTNSISTFTITKDGANYTVYGTWLPVRAGTMFKSSVAGKYYSFEGY